jgi:hypothetical protein
MDERSHAYREAAAANDEREGLESEEVRRAYAPPFIRPGDLLARDVKGLPYRVETISGEVHAVVGSRLVPEDPKTFYMWTRCGQDVSVRDVYASKEPVDCEACAAQERDAASVGSGDLNRLRLADLAYARARLRLERIEAEGGDVEKARQNVQDYRGIVHSLEQRADR